MIHEAYYDSERCANWKRRIGTAIFVACIGGAVLISCKKPPADKVVIPIADRRLADAVLIRPGSYFVYRDSETGFLDSFSVAIYEPYYDLNLDGSHTEKRRVIAFDSLDNVLQIVASTMYISGSMYRSGASGSDTNNYRIGFVRLPWIDSSFGSLGSIAGYPAIDSVSFRYIKHVDSTTVAGQIYTDVYKTESITHYRAAGQPIKMRFCSWFSINNCLIRFERGSISEPPQVFELIRSKIIK